MRISVICVGRVKEQYLRDAIAEYSKRLGRYCKLDIIEVADEKTPGESHIQLIIGGSIGLDDAILRRADYRLSFSKMTFPHQLMRVILLEQLYRAYKINAGEPYHK